MKKDKEVRDYSNIVKNFTATAEYNKTTELLRSLSCVFVPRQLDKFFYKIPQGCVSSSTDTTLLQEILQNFQPPLPCFTLRVSRVIFLF